MDDSNKNNGHGKLDESKVTAKIVPAETLSESIGEELSLCCDFPVKSFHTWPNLVKKHRTYFGVDLPVYADVTICTNCKNECGSAFKLVC